jgi:thiamine biosynthesis lipoprotein
MRFSLRPNPVNRAKPLLGTLVSIRAAGLGLADANRIIDCGFAEIAEIHRLMSFHEEDSDISRINRAEAGSIVKVNPRTVDVLREAAHISDATSGVFDVTIADRLVEWGYLPRPPLAPAPDENATWRDIEVIAPDRIRLHKSLWIDLGGIAKGYAVDCAIRRMSDEMPGQYMVNAGGDIRVSGPAKERIFLDVPPGADGAIPAFDLENGSIASSSGPDGVKSPGGVKKFCGRIVGPHIHGGRRRATGTRNFVSVIAERCIIADALTKVVMAKGAHSIRILKKFGATAYLRDGSGAGYVFGTLNSGAS